MRHQYYLLRISFLFFSCYNLCQVDNKIIAVCLIQSRRSRTGVESDVGWFFNHQANRREGTDLQCRYGCWASVRQKRVLFCCYDGKSFRSNYYLKYLKKKKIIRLIFNACTHSFIGSSFDSIFSRRRQYWKGCCWKSRSYFVHAYWYYSRYFIFIGDLFLCNTACDLCYSFLKTESNISYHWHQKNIKISC